MLLFFSLEAQAYASQYGQYSDPARQDANANANYYADTEFRQPVQPAAEDEGPSLSGFTDFLYKKVTNGLNTVKSAIGLGGSDRRADIDQRTHIYFDINIGNEYAGRINFELFDEVVPNTVANFRALATSKSKKRVLATLLSA